MKLQKLELGDIFQTYSIEDLEKLFKIKIVNDFVYCYKDLEETKFAGECHVDMLGKTMIVFSMNYRDYKEPVVTELINFNQVKEHFNHRINGYTDIKCDWFSDCSVHLFVKSYIKNIFDNLNN